MKRPNQSPFFMLLIFPLMLSGCSTMDYPGYFQEHERKFKATTKYVSHWIQRDSFEIYAREFGPTSQEPTLIMMHGFPDSLHLYDWLVPELVNDRHIITFDFLGWGESDKPADHRYNVASLRRDLEAVVAHFVLQNVVLVIHDASGQPGIDWALDNPGKVSGLVLLNTYYGPMPTLRAPEAIALFSTPGLRRDLSVWASRNFDAIWLKSYNEQMARFISTEAFREPFQMILGHQSLKIRPAFYQLNHVLRDEIESRKDMTALSYFTPPVRIIFGNDDPYLNPGVAKEFHKLFPNSELYLVENAGHFVQVDKPLQLADLLRHFPSIASSRHPTSQQLNQSHKPARE